MEKSPQNQHQPNPRPAVRSPLDARTGRMTAGSASPQEELKYAAMSLKDSSLSYLQAKAELAAIETKEASEYARKKLSLGLGALVVGIFTHAILLILIHGIILGSPPKILEQLANSIGLSNSNFILLVMLLFHLVLFFFLFYKLGKKPEEELFSHTKSEFQKDKQWLAEINQSNES